MNRTYFSVRHAAALLSVTAIVALTFVFWYSSPSHAQFSRDENMSEVMMAGTITGRVFQDFNQNGAYDTASGTESIDVGVANVTVSAYDSVGALQGTATSAANGTYSLVAGGTGPYRVEFTTLPSGFTPSARSNDSVLGGTATDAGSTVHFVNNLNTSNVNLAVTRAEDYCQNNPTIVIPRYAQGASNGTYANNAVLYDFPYLAGTTYTDTTVSNYDNPLTHSLTTTAATLGTINSIAYNRATNRIYVASYFKKHSGFGPGANGILNDSDDPGAIYVVNPATSAVVSTFTVPNATTNSHDVLDYSSDNGDAGWDATGKTSLGGMALADDNSRLFVMNLQDRRLYALNPTTGANLGSSASVTSLTLPTPGGTSANCADNNNKRPFAVTYYRGTVYIGVVCTSETGTASAANLFAYVFAVNPTTLAITATPSFSAPLNYNRGFADPSVAAEWRPWVATMQTPFAFPMPMLTDIEFENGNMVLGVRDRTGDAALDAGPDAKRTAGDTLRACGTFGSWTLESNGRCGGTGTAPQNTGQGPGEGEFYHQDDFCLTPNGANYHDEVSWGSLLYIPGRQHVMSTLLDPISRTIDSGATFDGGIRLWNNNTGNADRAYRIYNGLGGVGQPDFGKTNGLGSLVAMCNQSPIEIGNRIWRDSNGNGVQDPGELPVANATVTLWGDTDGNGTVDAQIGTTTTNANGHYIFGGANNTNMLNYSCGTTTGSVDVRVDSSSDDAEQATTGGAVTLNSIDFFNEDNGGGGTAYNNVGVRFNNITIPQGATITSAYIQFTANNSGTVSAGNPTYTIQGQNVDNAATFATTANNISGRTWLSGQDVSWSPGAWTQDQTTNTSTPSLTNIVQAIVNRGGWASGNSMAFRVTGSSTNALYREAESWDGGAAAAPRLVVTYSMPASCTRRVDPNTAYQIRLDNPANYNVGGPLAGLILTVRDQTSQLGNDDASDSDASTVANPVGSPAGNFPVIAHTTGGAGSNNHTLDIGFYLPPSASFASVAGRLTTADGFGIRNVQISLVQEDGTVRITKTGSFGYYRFDDLLAGQSVVLNVASKRYTFNPSSRVVLLTDDISDFDWVSEQ
ncbi:MAG TPA: SdrD B-like domain-containing protein [Pyrinomonadaceae bacterium]|nr:SdrD B-like domain-containing protein [Pyrinomonadaceae bacterium]